eukprot:CAMPEP_0117061480 /NCGR_PEP_ID=MMETSP0472-20121206/42797_1 /TAXON_ID=693140 ORGANISM="Tiarina fusus, Strain LIS" /NCGR_SAMPLE_ID=MMETSP0472 /ASSEMBLY_ACC=CAM_ASM_000603 /LENGTH=349 /DNA_ID=CAMNT_0004780165 /DNA_START=22 /DNA_END=1071 /DNA_ORIENTATION=+
MKKVIVSFRGEKVEFTLTEEFALTVGHLKRSIAEVSRSTKHAIGLEPSAVKLILKGKVLCNDDDDLRRLLAANKKKAIQIMATGVSQQETEQMEFDFQDGVQKAKRLVRDDISDKGKQRMKERHILGRQMMKKASASSSPSRLQSSYGFGRIETLPNLPNEFKAREILTELANDPGVKACMAKHKWNVGSLAELYPEGKVGETAVCVMGLNKNRGKQILLRIRTDDLKGFRKMLSIREVLYHELAHNVHSEHNAEFFQLMRQIKTECLEMDWTNGNGVSTIDQGTDRVTGGTCVLGGGISQQCIPAKELAGRAAALRLTAEEEEVRASCGCGYEEALSRIRNQDGQNEG